MFALSAGARRRVGTLSLALLLALPAVLAVQAQGASHTFPQTGHTVSGLFWTYWQAHGGLAQQGYPLSEPFSEKSEVNGQTYVVQYFERAVFEVHPANQPPFDVLLSLLGTARYQARYPQGAPGQVANKTAGHYFAETGHWVGGQFWTYWQAHGGLAQQGYPISDEFTEISELNNTPYMVQYFQRAVFERHLENAPPFDVLLSQLGTFQLHRKYPAGPPTPAAGPSPAPTVGGPQPVPPAVHDLLSKSDAAMNSLSAMKAHSVNSTTDAGTTTVDTADYQYQAPDRQYLKVTSPRPGQPVAIAEVIRIGTQRYQKTSNDAHWTASTDATPYRWPAYNKVYVADHALQTTLRAPETINGVPVQVVEVALPVASAPTQVDQDIRFYISTVDFRDLREVTVVPPFPPSRTASGTYTSDFFDFNVPNSIAAPP